MQVLNCIKVVIVMEKYLDYGTVCELAEWKFLVFFGLLEVLLTKCLNEEFIPELFESCMFFQFFGPSKKLNQ